MYPEPADPVFGCFVRDLNQALVGLGAEVKVARRPEGRRGPSSYGHLLSSAVSQMSRIELVHGHYLGPAAALAVAVGRARGVPVVLTAHGSDVAAARRRVVRFGLGRLVRRARAIHFVSRDLEARAAAFVPRELRRLVHPIGIQVARFARGARGERRPGPARLLFVGRLSPEKGWRDAVAAAGHLARGGRELELIMCTAGDPAEMERALAEEGLADRTRRLGVVAPERLPAVYAEADVVMVPSLREGFGHVGLEAMAAGVPVVSTGAGGLSEYMRDGENALLVPVSEPPALAAAVARLLDAPELAARLSEAGRLTAPRYDVQRCAEAVFGLYRELVSP